MNLGRSWWDRITTFGQDNFFLVKFTGGSGRVGIASRRTTLSEAHRAAKLSKKIMQRINRISTTSHQAKKRGDAARLDPYFDVSM